MSDGLDFGRALEQLATAAGEALKAEAQAIARDAAERAPTGSTGELKASVYVGQVRRDGDELAVDVGFVAPYAGIVHERADAHHDDGESKFLEHALEAGTGFAEALAGRMRSA